MTLTNPMRKQFFFHGWASGSRLRTPAKGYEIKKVNISFTVARKTCVSPSYAYVCIFEVKRDVRSSFEAPSAFEAHMKAVRL
jgi:hypothetical protein